MEEFDDDSVRGASCEVFPDYETGQVVSRFIHPETGETVMELHLAPDVAREYAFNQTRASIAIEDHQKRH
jgi:hypothetical protein